MDTQMVSVLIRIPAALREELRRAARESRRSVTAETVHRLEQSFKADASRERRRHAVEQQRGESPRD